MSDAPRNPKRSPGQVGASFEKLLDLSAAKYCYRPNLPPIGARRIKGGELIPLRMPYDRILFHNKTGRGICLDAKSCSLSRTFPVGNEDHLPTHQRDALIEAGQRCPNIIAGLLVEASHPDLSLVLWLPWPVLINPPPSIPWDDDRFVEIGPNEDLINFDALVEHYTRKVKNCG